MTGAARALVGDRTRAQGLAAGSPEHDPAVVAAEAAVTDPRDLAHRTKLVEQARLVAGDPGREDVSFQHRGRDREAGELVDDLGQALERRGRPERRRGRAEGSRDPLPGRQEPAEHDRIDRLDLATQARERSPAQEPQDLWIAPFPLRTAGTELTAQDRPGREEPFQRILDLAERRRPARRRVGRQERPVGPRPARHEAVECTGHSAQERVGHAGRRLHPERVTVPRDVLDRDEPTLATDPDGHGTMGALERRQALDRGLGTGLRARRNLAGRQVAEPTQQVVDLVDRARRALRGQRLERQLEIGQCLGIDELAQLLLAEQLAEQVPVEGQRLRAALGQRRVAVVHVGGHVVKQERARERRGARRLDRVDDDLAPGHTDQHVAQRGQVEDIGQAFAVRLDEDRERAVARRDREQVGRPLTLLPERGSGARPATRQEQRPGRVLAEARGEQRRIRDRTDDQVLDLLGLGEQGVLDPVELAFGQAHGDAVVRPDRLDLAAEPLAQPGLDRHRPRGMDPTTEWRQDRQPPVAKLVPEALDDDAPIGRQGAHGLLLVLEIGDEVLGRQGVEVVPLAQPGQDGGPATRAPTEVVLDLAHEATQRAPELDRPADRVAVPERQLAGQAGRGRDDDPIVADLLDPPAARTERDHLADPALVHHLLVELADPSTGRARLADHEHAVQAAVRDRAARCHGHDPRVASTFDRVGHAVPDEARLELGELVRRIRAGEHPEHALEDLPGEALVRRRPGDGREQLVDRPAVQHGHRHDLLGQHVERVAGQRGRLDRGLVHARGDDGRLQQVASELREDHAGRRGSDLVPGSPDPLEPGRDRGR